MSNTYPVFTESAGNTAKKVEYFGLQRKIVSHMTTQSWQEIPHVSSSYEPDVTDFFQEYQRMNEYRIAHGKAKISFNTIMLKVISEGLKAAPALNATIEFKPKSVSGTITQHKNIDISVPWTLPNGEMMTITMPNVNELTLDGITDAAADINRRLKNTNLNEALYEVAFEETIGELKKMRVGVIRRIVASAFGKGKVKLLTGDKKREYNRIPINDRITKKDLRQGTVTISNIGSLNRKQKGEVSLLMIIPPQVFVVAIGAVQEKPGIYLDKNGNKQIGIRQILPFCLTFDHRAADFEATIPFTDRLDEIFANPTQMYSW